MARTFADTIARVEPGPRMLTFNDGHGSSPGSRPTGRASNQGVLGQLGLEEEMERLMPRFQIRTVQHVYTNFMARTVAAALQQTSEFGTPVDQPDDSRPKLPTLCKASPTYVRISVYR